MIRILPLDRAYPKAWALMPAALERVRRFCDNYRTDLTAAVLCPNVIRHFAVERDPSIRVIVAVDDTTIIGHLVASIEEFSGSLHLWIVQYELDTGVPLRDRLDTFDQLLWWAARKGATSVRIMAPLDDRAMARIRLYQRIGFKAQRVTMEMPVPTTTPVPVMVSANGGDAQ